MRHYNPKEIEPKWQKYWDEHQTYKADLNSSKPKYIAMSMLNYPSGDGIHIGHAMNYTISDVMARFRRQQGDESYHPVGWDAFGLPAENYAIRTGISPQASMAKIIPMYHKQYKAMGWSNDWSKEISTHDPEYYRWTQWIFAEMFRRGLAYQDSRMQWWCSKDNTVLADEQVTSEGKCWRHDGPDDPLVQKREVKQWFFKITDYADELLEAIDDLDWSESVKLAQKNWIGKSVGAEIEFAVDGAKEKIKVFTTRPDTIFGATFLVLAPEHPILNKLSISSETKEYAQQAIRKSDLQRQENKDKTGVSTGLFAINPATKEKIPIWVADYVLGSYGAGAIMAVPAHDERDYEFAKKFDLPITQVIKSAELPYAGEGVLVNSGKYNGMDSAAARNKIIAGLAGAKSQTNYRMRDWSISRQRYWGAPIPIIHCPKCGPQLVPDEDLPVILPELKDFEPSGDGRSALARSIDWVKAPCSKCGGIGERETDTLDTYVDSSWYMLRYLDPQNHDQIFDSTIINKWSPIDFYNGADHATAHMIYARFVTRFFHKIGLLENPEPFEKFLFNGKVTASDGQMFSKSKGNGVDPLEIIDSGYGADALRTYLMFAAPLDTWVRWDPQGVPGTYRFLNRIWNLVQEFLEIEAEVGANVPLGAVHQTIQKVTVDIGNQKYNTAIAAMMQLVNDLYRAKSDGGVAQSAEWRFALESLAQLVAPFAPHVAEELWQELGHKDSISSDHWPICDDKLAKPEKVTVGIQINGKIRSEISVSTDITEKEAVTAAKADAKVAELIKGKKISKAIYVPGRLVSLVID